MQFLHLADENFGNKKNAKFTSLSILAPAIFYAKLQLQFEFLSPIPFGT
jgi:hypothetical protein